MKRVPGAVVIPEVYLYNLLLIVSYKFNACQQKKPENQGFCHNFPATQRLQPSIEFIIIGQSRHEKDLVFCLMRILARCVEVLR